MHKPIILNHLFLYEKDLSFIRMCDIIFHIGVISK